MKNVNPARIFQYGVKCFILGLATYLAVMHQFRGILEAANAHAYCPFGGLESIYKLILSGGYIDKIMPATMILLGITVLMVVVLNRAFCGWICPLGTLQTLFDRLARFLKIKKVQVPQSLETKLQYLKYAGLVVILYFTWRLGELVYAPYDPWAAYTHLAAGWSELYEEFLIGGLFLLAALIGSLWLPNNFCRYFCPMGAFLGILSKLSPTRIARNEQTCINCKKCDKVCPAQIQISTQPTVSSPECLACGDCVTTCPVDKTLEFRTGKKFPVHWMLFGILTVALFFGPVWISEQLGYWKTGYMSAAEALTDQSGKLNPARIKGSMPLDVVAKEFGVPLEAILKKFNLSTDAKTTGKLKDFAVTNNLAPETFMGEFRVFITEYLNGGADTKAASAPPHSAIGVKPPAVPSAPSVQTAPQAPTAAAPDIRGKTTISDLVGYGMNKERFKEVTGFDLPADGQMALRDFASAHGLEMDTLKGKLMEALERK